MQKDVNISKTVGGVSSLIGSIMGITGGILVFTPAAPAGIIVGLVGLGISGTGILVESGAGVTNYFIGKNGTENLKIQMQNEANINLDAFLQTLENIDKLTKLYIKDANSTRLDNIKTFDLVRDQIETPDEGRNEDGESVHPIEGITTNTGQTVICDYIATSWLQQKFFKNYQNVPATVLDKVYDCIAKKTGMRPTKIKEHLDVLKLVGNIGPIGNSIRGITQDAIFVASESFRFLAQASDDVVVNLVKGSITTNNVDEAALAANITSRIGSTTSKVFNGLGIAGGILGIAFTSYSIHQTRKSLEKGSPSEKAELIETVLANTDKAFTLREIVESTCTFDNN